MEQIITSIHALWTYLETGGVVMIPLLFCSILGGAIILLKLVQLRQKKVITPEIVRIVHSVQDQKDSDIVRRICSEKRTPLANIILAGLENWDLGYEDIKETILDQSRQETRILERGLVSLETIAAIAPLLGLLGTVLGMVDVFSEIAHSELVQATQLSRGISKALVTTVAGLSIGIIALVSFNFLIHKVEMLLLDIEQYANQFFSKLKRVRPSNRIEEVPLCD